jgi:hypothetical protein
MKIVKWILIVAGIILAFLIVYLARYGLFAKITVTEKPLSSFVMVYRKYVGPYQGIGPVMDSLYKDVVSTYNIKPVRGIGLYYDNPREVPAEKLRSLAGCIVESGDLGKVAELKKKYYVREYPAGQAVAAEFPFKGKPAIILGVFRVYPKMTKYIDGRGYPMSPMLEIYDMPAHTIIYAMSLGIDASIFEGFLVSEPEPIADESVDSTVVLDE